MARRSYSRGRGRSRSTSRGSYRASSPRRSYRSRARTSRRGSSASRTVRIVIEQGAPSVVQRPDMPVGIGLKTAAPLRNKSRF